MDRLAILCLSKNEITGALPSLNTELRFLDISENHITDLSMANMEQVKRLKDLNLSRNELQFVSFKFPKNITNLDISHNNIKSADFLSKDRYRKLKVIRFSFNYISSFPENFSLPRLELLDLSSNLLGQLPLTIGNLSHLKVLNCSKNNIIKLPVSFGFLIKLESLDLSDNTKLTELPISIGGLESLSSLSISGTGISELPPTVANLRSLSYISLERTKMPKELIKNWETSTEKLKIVVEHDYNMNIDCFKAKMYIFGETKFSKTSFLQTLCTKKGWCHESDKSEENFGGISTGKVSYPTGELHFFNYPRNIKYDTYFPMLEHYENTIYFILFELGNKPSESVSLMYLKMLSSIIPGQSITLIGFHDIDTPPMDVQIQMQKMFRLFKNVSSGFRFIAVGDIDSYDNIRTLISEHMEAKKSSVPQKFLALGDSLRDFCSMTGKFILKTEEIFPIAKTCGIKGEAIVIQALVVLSRLGGMMYFKHNWKLKDYVFMSTATVADFIDHFFVESLPCTQDSYLTFQGFSSFANEKNEEHLRVLLYLLEHMRILILDKKEEEIFCRMNIDESNRIKELEYKFRYSYTEEYEFSAIPPFFIDILFKKLFKSYNMIHVWHDCFIGKTRNQEVKIILTMIESLKHTTIKIEVCSDVKNYFVLVTRDLKKMLMEEISKFRNLDYFSYILHKSEDKEIKVPSGDLVKQYMSGITEITLGDGLVIPLSDLSPDICLNFSDTIKESDVNLQAEIGRGGYSIVYKGIWNEKKVAVKMMTFENPDPVNDELFVHGNLKSPYIAELITFCFDPFFLVLEFCKGVELYKYLHNESVYINWNLKIKVLYDIAMGLDYLQTQDPPVAHLDLKTPNVILYSEDIHSDTTIKLIDFGLSRRILSPVSERLVDNPTWLAPEILKGEYYDETVDIYAFGIIMWEVLFRKTAYENLHFIDIENYVLSGNRPKIFSHCPPQLKTLIDSCWIESCTIFYTNFSSFISPKNSSNFRSPVRCHRRGHDQFREDIPKRLRNSTNAHSRNRKKRIRLVDNTRRRRSNRPNKSKTGSPEKRQKSPQLHRQTKHSPCE
eukprot:TRINITY_DN2115_c0_g1_i2.p1 TRINITY_DN2115_c0_g1~~TRINITY_DN2115_c0_g1_i2.p1  ORF type:complete len:1109 (+),score=175.73 TRINITY_DN2115_c0_g1_i2:132-3329(+)